MTLSELIDLHLSDVGLFREFLACMIMTSTLFVFMVVIIFRGTYDLLKNTIKKMIRYIYFKRHGAAINNTIDGIYILAQNDEIEWEQADFIKDALVYYARKKKIKKK